MLADHAHDIIKREDGLRHFCMVSTDMDMPWQKILAVRAGFASGGFQISKNQTDHSDHLVVFHSRPKISVPKPLPILGLARKELISGFF